MGEWAEERVSNRGPTLSREDKKHEVWKDLPGWPYEVSNMGRVRRKRHVIVDSMGRERLYQQKIMTPTLKDWVCQVNLSYKGKVRTFSVKKLVAEFFVPPYSLGGTIRHRDGDPANCKHYNLYRDTKQGNRKITLENREEIEELIRKGYNKKDIAEKYGVSVHLIRSIGKKLR